MYNFLLAHLFITRITLDNKHKKKNICGQKFNGEMWNFAANFESCLRFARFTLVFDTNNDS